jgi:hypothetical protein
MNIQQETLDEVLKYYREEARYLKEAKLDYPEAIGKFQIPHSWYLADEIETGHFNAIDLIVCYNQLTFATFSEAIKLRLIEGIDYEKFRETRLEAGLIIDMNNIKFHKPIDPREFSGVIKTNDVLEKRNGNLWIVKTQYDFDGGKATGYIDLAFLNN